MKIDFPNILIINNWTQDLDFIFYQKLFHNLVFLINKPIKSVILYEMNYFHQFF